MASGANGYVIKHSAGEELLTAIREVSEGRTFMTPWLSGIKPPPTAG